MANEMNNPLVRAQAQVKTACDKLGLENQKFMNFSKNQKDASKSPSQFAWMMAA